MSQSPHNFSFDSIENRPKAITQEVLAEICKRLIDNIRPKKILLFGSHANETASNHSDLDLLVVISHNHPLARLKRRERYTRILRLFPHKGFGLDMMVLTDSEIQEIVEKNEGEWDLVLEILEHGKPLYEQKTQDQ